MQLVEADTEVWALIITVASLSQRLQHRENQPRHRPFVRHARRVVDLALGSDGVLHDCSELQQPGDRCPERQRPRQSLRICPSLRHRDPLRPEVRAGFWSPLLITLLVNAKGCC